MQIDGKNDDVMKVKPVDKKFKAFLAKQNLFENFQEYLMKNGDYGNLVAWFGDNNIDIDNIDIWKYGL